MRETTEVRLHLVEPRDPVRRSDDEQLERPPLPTLGILEEMGPVGRRLRERLQVPDDIAGAVISSWKSCPTTCSSVGIAGSYVVPGGSTWVGATAWRNVKSRSEPIAMESTSISGSAYEPAGDAAGRTRAAAERLTFQTAHVMSWAQHMGDLIMPCPSGHLETATLDPSGLLSVSCTSSESHLAQVMLTLMPHLSQV
jgi:hypothetical protein